MHRFYIKYVWVAVLFIPLASHSTAYQGVIRNVFALNGKVFIYIKNGGDITYCNQTQDFFIAWIDPETEYGKMMFSIALTSKVTEKLVWVAGNNNCVDAASGRKAEAMRAIDLKG